METREPSFGLIRFVSLTNRRRSPRSAHPKTSRSTGLTRCRWNPACPCPLAISLLTPPGDR
jgi:hypothetical protein